jgi:hypothetical protein
MIIKSGQEPTTLKSVAPAVRSRLTKEDRKVEPAADWSDCTMAAVVAVVLLGMPLLAFLFR